MPYTTQGYMTAADLADYRALTDTGTTIVHPHEEDPVWHATHPADCPVCGDLVADHDAVRLADASGEIVACLYGGSAGWEPLP